MRSLPLRGRISVAGRTIALAAGSLLAFLPGARVVGMQVEHGEERVAFTASIDARRTLRLEGTGAAEAITAVVSAQPRSPSGGGRPTIAIEYRRSGTTGGTRRFSFRLDAFDRMVVRARGGADFINVVDVAELLDSQRKVLALDGGEGDNVVVFSHRPFTPQTAARIQQLLAVSRQVDELAKRAGAATSQALAADAMKLIDSVRSDVAGVSRTLAADAERQVVAAASELAERKAPPSIDRGNALVARSEELAKQHAALVEELSARFRPNDDGGQSIGEISPRQRDADLPETDPAKEKEAAEVRVQAERLAREGLELGDEAKAEGTETGRLLEADATALAALAAELEKRAEQLALKAELVGAGGEKEMTAAAERVLAAVAGLRSLEGRFREAGRVLDGELQLAISLTAAKRATAAAGAAGATGCNSPVTTTQTYTGGGGSDFFLPISSPSQSWSISGGGGNDLLFGGLAADDIHGGAGTDVIAGLKGNDHIHGDAGIDLLFGEFFVDLSSFSGNDCIWGDAGIDLVVGDNFLDSQSGTAGGDDSLWGGTGIDLVVGDDVLSDIFSQTRPGGADAIEGGKDIDLLFGGGGDDDIKGNDDIDFAEGNGGKDVIDGGAGRSFTLCNTSLELGNLLLGGNDDDQVTGGAGIDVIFGNDANDQLTGKGQLDVVFGGPGADRMFGDAGGVICVVNGVPIRLGNLMLGGPGDDRMRAGGDLDVMLGQDDNDDIHGYDGSTQAAAAIDADVLLGGPGNDVMVGDNEEATLSLSIDFLFGGPGDDDMRGGKFIDLGFGGPGKDRLRGDSNALLLVASIDLLFGGPDDDWIDGGNSLDLVFGQGGTDTLLGDDETAGLISPDLLFGGPGNDTMNGGSSLDLMFGEGGADRVVGDSNRVWQPLSADLMWGGPGADEMDGGNSLDFMWGGPDCDTMRGDDSTAVRISPDFMFGQGDSDDMDGGNTTDFMWGGDGHDKMAGDRQLGQPLSFDFMWGDDGYDTMLGGQSLDFMWGGRGVDEVDGQSGPDLLFGGDNGDYVNGGDALDFAWGNDGNDLIHGNQWPDFILGGSGDDCLYGDDGQDLVVGDAGRDCLRGGSHVDLLFGGNDDDLILGDNGTDLLFGGGGHDRLDGGAAFDLIFGGAGGDEGWRGAGGALFFSVGNKHNGGSGLDCDCRPESRTGKICVHKFDDRNGNSVVNAGEPGLEGWTFQVTGSCVGATLVTAAGGAVCGDFLPGTYSVAEQLQSGWTATTPTTQTAGVVGGQTTDLYFGNRRTDCRTIDEVPAATLLLPFFAVDMANPSGVTTLFSINNAAASPVLTHITIWSDKAVPVFAFNLYLDGLGSQAVNLREVLIDGNLPGAVPVPPIPSCPQLPYPPGAVSAALRSHLQEWLSGRRSDMLGTNQCAGTNYGDNIARGYVTVDTVNACTSFSLSPANWAGYAPFITNQNVLWGDYFYVRPENNFACGANLVHIEACPTCFKPGGHTFYGRYNGASAADAREPLPTTFEASFASGVSGTSLVVWRETDASASPFTCGLAPSWSPLDAKQIISFDSTGQSCQSNQLIPDAANSIAVSSLSPLDTTKVYLNLQHSKVTPIYGDTAAQAWVALGPGECAVVDVIQLDCANAPITSVISTVQCPP